MASQIVITPAGGSATILGGSSVTGCNTNTFQQGGLAEQTTDPLGATVDTIYDDNGRVIGTQHSGDMRWTCMIYDVRGRVTDVTNRNANLVHTHYYLPGQGADVTCGTIEPNQVCTRFVDSAGTIRFTKTESDLLGRTVKYTDELGTQTRTLYDQVGRVIERWRKLPAVTDKKILSYAYDSYGRASSWSEFVSATAGRTTTTFYDTYSRPVEVDRPTNTYPLRTVIAYEANTGRLDTQVSSRNTTTLFSNNLDYSLAGRISQDARIGAGRQYAYDGAGRLTSATDTPSGVSRSYGFDANSNRCANATTCASPTFSYNAGDQLTTSPYGSGYVYDTYGNLDTYAKTGGGSVNFDYDSYDHTIRIDDGTTRVDSVLSPDGRVLRRTVSSPPGVTITEDRWYGYTDSSDSPAWSQATSGGAYTTYLSNLVVTGTTPSYQVSDPKGTVVGTVTQAGAFTAMPIPDEYGNIATVPASRLDWLGTQKRFVDHPGLDIVRMGVRAYDPHIGRFLSQDPIVGGSANDYDYVNADPINNLDLAGTWCWTCRGTWRKAARNLINVRASAGAQLWALAHGARCHRDSRTAMTVCAGARGGYMRSGTTIGSVFITGATPDARKIRHEQVHAEQWASRGGGLRFAIEYGIAEWVSGGGSKNPFERQANLRDGCYEWRLGC